jgi:hypothetical protein
MKTGAFIVVMTGPHIGGAIWWRNEMTITKLMTGAAAAALFATPALAGDRDRALMAISQAQASIQIASSAGAETAAADAQTQAHIALERAQRQMAKSNEHRAYYAAREADAYARLALAKAQTRMPATPTNH